MRNFQAYLIFGMDRILCLSMILDVEEYSTFPQIKYDGSICTDVVEQIPEA